MLHELHIFLINPPVLYCDNIDTKYLCANPVFHSRMKHITIDFHFVRDRVQNEELRVSHVSSFDQLVDVLTKLVSRQQLQQLCVKIGVSTRPISRGHDKAIQWIRIYCTVDKDKDTYLYFKKPMFSIFYSMMLAITQQPGLTSIIYIL